MQFPVWVIPVLVALLKLVVKVLEGAEPSSPAHLLDQLSTDVVKSLPGHVEKKTRGRKSKAPQPQEDPDNG